MLSQSMYTKTSVSYTHLDVYKRQEEEAHRKSEDELFHRWQTETRPDRLVANKPGRVGKDADGTVPAYVSYCQRSGHHAGVSVCEY